MDLLFFFVAFLSEVIGTIAGFGSSTILLPLALFFFDFQTALVIVAFMHIFGNISRVNFFKKGLDIKILLNFGLPSIIFTIVGALLVSFISQNILKGVLGIFLVIYGIYLLWKEKFRLKTSLSNMLIGGGTSGFFAGLIGTGGALRSAFLTSFGLSKNTYIATIATIAIAVDLTRIPVYLAQGFLNSKYYWYLPILFGLALVGSFIGKQVIQKFPYNTFRKIVLLSILFVGLKFILDWLT